MREVLWHKLDEVAPDVLGVQGWSHAFGLLTLQWAARRGVPRVVLSESHAGRQTTLVVRRESTSVLPPHWEAAELEGVTLHQCRHTFASFAIAAGANAKTLSTYMGHANISITLDRYGHLMPGSEREFAGLLDSYLERTQRG